MTIEFARTLSVPQPWGVVDRKFPIASGDGGKAIGEIRYERPGEPATEPALLLKVLLTSQPLSIQVHPDDTQAQSVGLQNGKTEAWYVVSAGPEAKVALGLIRRITREQFREAVEDGAITELIAWRPVSTGDVIAVPAGTIHAIGANLIIAEIQQRSETTYRIFDHGRERELHIESAIRVASTGPVVIVARPLPLTDERTLLVSNAHFIFESVRLPPSTVWWLEAERETWFLALSGDARAGSFDIATGDAIFAQSDDVNVHVGPHGLTGLLAYTGLGGPLPDLLLRISELGSTERKRAEGLKNRAATTSTTSKSYQREESIR